MKKNIFFTSLLATLILFFSFPSFAMPAPSLQSSTFTVLEGGAQSLVNNGFASESVFPVYGDFDATYFPFESGAVLGSEITEFFENDLTITPLTSDEMEYLQDNYSFYNSVTGADQDFSSYEGQIYLVTFDNGFISGNGYISEDGTLLSSSPGIAGSYINYKFGGSTHTVPDWLQVYKSLSDDVKNSASYVVNDNFQSVSDSGYYYWVGSSYHSQPSSAWQIYISNQYIPGVIVPSTTSGYINSWYTNEPELVYYRQTHYYQNDPQYEDNRLSVTVGNYSKNGFSYRYLVSFSAFFGEYKRNGVPVIHSYSNWVNGISSSADYWFAQSGCVYDSSKDFGNDKAFKPLQYPDGSTVNVVNGDYFDYSALQQLEEDLGWSDPETNPDYDNTQELDPDNYPFVYPIGPGVRPRPSSNPLPGGVPIPDTGPHIDYPPEIQPDPEVVEGSFSNFSIPALQNIFKRYPFCIPWDIKKFFEGFVSRPEAPAWNFDWDITVLGHTYSTHVEGDLSDFDSLAQLFRNLVTVSFIVGLAIFSYKNHF